jgi:uncharacterized protein (DUF983 family)
MNVCPYCCSKTDWLASKCPSCTADLKSHKSGSDGSGVFVFLFVAAMLGISSVIFSMGWQHFILWTGMILVACWFAKSK